MDQFQNLRQKPPTEKLCAIFAYCTCYMCVHVQPGLTLCDPMDCSPPASSVYGILQARMLEWVAISLLQGVFLTQGLNHGPLHCRQTSLPSEPPEKPILCTTLQLSKFRVWIFALNMIDSQKVLRTRFINNVHAV